MKLIKLAALLLAACLFSACTIYHQEPPRRHPAGNSGPQQQNQNQGKY